MDINPVLLILVALLLCAAVLAGCARAERSQRVVLATA